MLLYREELETVFETLLDAVIVHDKEGDAPDVMIRSFDGRELILNCYGVPRKNAQGEMSPSYVKQSKIPIVP